MDSGGGYIVRFFRKDGKFDEEFYHRTYGEAADHLNLFRNDDSGVYGRIEIVSAAEPDIPCAVLEF